MSVGSGEAKRPSSQNASSLTEELHPWTSGVGGEGLWFGKNRERGRGRDGEWRERERPPGRESPPINIPSLMDAGHLNKKGKTPG